MADRPLSLPARVWERVNDPARQETLAALSALESYRDEDFLRLNRMAAAVCDAPFSAIAVVDAKHASLVSAIGLELRQVPVEHSLAAHVIGEDGRILFVGDARGDERFAASTLVTGPPLIRFYAGAPITVHNHQIGALQVLGPEPRESLPDAAQAHLQDLAATASALLELKHEARVRSRTASELIKEEWRHALTLEAGKVGSWVWDIPTGGVVANDILRRMFGLSSQGGIHIDQIMGAIEPEDRAAVDQALKATLEEGLDYSVEFRVAGTGRWLVGRGRVYQRSPSDKPLVMMGVNIDVTDARRSAEHTRLLLRELNHRVKNTLAMIQSLARQTLRQSPEPQRFIDSFAGRLRTLSDAHSLLSDRDWSGIGLVELIESTVRPFTGDAAQLVLEGNDLQLPPDHALGMGMILHELSTNAAQFGALSVPEGTVTIGWSIMSGAQRRLELRWIERGGPTVHEPQKRGLGARLIERGLDKVIDSEVELKFAPNGVEALVRLPLA